MLELAFALFLCLLTVRTLQGGLVSNGQVVIFAGYKLWSLGIFGCAFAALMVFLGPVHGLAVVLSIMVHEYGHVVAYRIAGHSDARFRLIPLMESVGISKTAPKSQEKEFFINIMGSGICLAPMVTGFVIAHLLRNIAPDTAALFWAFASVTAALNFVNLLPFWPLDGGRCLRSLCHSFWPGATRTLTLIMSAATAAAAVHLQSTGLFLLTLMSAQALMQPEDPMGEQSPMPTRTAAVAAGAYLFTAAAHLLGGWLVISSFF